MNIPTLSRPIHLSRRAFLRVGASTALPFLAFPAMSQQVVRALNTEVTMNPSIPRSSDLYVFDEPHSRSLVIALLVPAESTAGHKASQAGFQAIIHAGNRAWSLWSHAAQSSAMISEHGSARFYVGDVAENDTHRRESRRAVIIESPLDHLHTDDDLQVWAEVYPQDRPHFRVGNPFVTHIMASDPWRKARHFFLSPLSDQTLLSRYIAERAEAIAADAGSVANPRAHGARVAAIALPNVISYRPNLPVGFNFVQQNGRHPGDDVVSVVETVVSGTPTHRAPCSPIRLGTTFPYFSPAARTL